MSSAAPFSDARTGIASSHHQPQGPVLPLALAALGVVYGDIGTSPLYTMQECFLGPHAQAITKANVLGVCSLIIWALILVVTIKYVVFIMRADNDGEGGIFALLALLHDRTGKRKMPALLPVAAIIGAALLYGDGIITPAISVLSAVEGLTVATDAATPYVLPVTCAVLLILFLAQRSGTERIGQVFGPVMVVWFATIAALGLRSVFETPGILEAFNPYYGFAFFMAHGPHGLLILGSVVLCITGGEALYADMGHFGARPIRLSWMTMVLPALFCNYMGQGAMLLRTPELTFNPFYALVPREMLYPMVVLSTVATVIASQAMISGCYSLTQQAIQLGYCPRLRILHTSEKARGQIYMPTVNHALMVSCIALVLGFGASSKLAGAYGIAVTATMGLTSILFLAVLKERMGWPAWKAGALVGLFLFTDIAFLGANLFKVLDGGWITLCVAAAASLLMLTWRDGRAALAARHATMSMPIDMFIDDVKDKHPYRVPGTAVFMSVSPTGTPLALLHHYKHNRVLHERVIILTISAGSVPQVHPSERLTVHDLGGGFIRLVAQYGFMESPSVPEIVGLATQKGIPMKIMETTFFLGRETLLPTGPTPMARWRKELLILMSRNAWNATMYFGIPAERVVEIGAQVEL